MRPSFIASLLLVFLGAGAVPALLPGPALADPPAAMAREARSQSIENDLPTVETGSDDKQPSPALSKTDLALVEAIGDELRKLGEEAAIEELNRIARLTLALERPDLFRAIMVAFVDPHWEGLSQARTALNMIGWLPDTADYLAPRITAARLAISAGELPQIEAQRLWRDLRARVERVGDPLLLRDLAAAMIASQDTGLLIDTINRFHATDRERLRAFSSILELDVLDPASAVSKEIYSETERLFAADVPNALTIPEVSRAFWKSGRHERALEVLALEGDTVTRLQIMTEFMPSGS